MRLRGRLTLCSQYLAKQLCIAETDPIYAALQIENEWLNLKVSWAPSS